MRIELKLLHPSDFPLIVEWVNAYDKDFLFLWAGYTYSYPLTLEQMIQHYSHGINSVEAGVFVYKVWDKDSQEVIGTAQLGKMDSITKEAVFGRFLLKAEWYRGQGLGTRVLENIVHIAFEKFDLNRIKLNVFHTNLRAIHCYEKVGFVKGQYTENVYQSINGEPWDRIEMVLDKELWLAKKSHAFKPF